MRNEGEEENPLLAEARAVMGIDESAKGEDDGLEDTFLQVSAGAIHIQQFSEISPSTFHLQSIFDKAAAENEVVVGKYYILPEIRPIALL